MLNKEKTMNRFVINGVFYAQTATGVHRFARELILELDKIIQPNKIKIITPKYSKNLPKLKNIEIIKVGNRRPILWEQTDFVKYLFRNKVKSISLCNTLPLANPGIICIHDAAYKAHPEYFTSLHGKLSRIWHMIHFRIAAIRNEPILTVSYFSKYQIIDEYKVDPKRIHVIGNGWQHMKRIDYDKKILKDKGLNKNEYFFTLGNVSKNKNTKWVYEVAKRHPEYKFVVSGRKAEVSNEKYEELSNILNLGYITDSEIKTLMKNCKAFIFPSIHEGFGIPPMEALSQEAKIIIANTTCLPEIYKDSAFYIDPYDFDVNLNELLSKKVSSGEKVLEEYSWSKSAKILCDLILNN